MNDSQFISIAEKTLIEISDKIEDIDSKSIFDCEYTDGILTVKLFDHSETYVINKHSASKKIWFSSPVSGADYFSYDQSKQKWLNSNNQQLQEKLFSEIKKFLKK